MDDRRRLVQIKRFGQVIERACPSRHSGVQTSKRSDHDNRDGPEQLAKPVHRRQAIDAWKPNVEHNQIGLRFGTLSSASSADEATLTAWPSPVKRRLRPQQMLSSSSTIRMLDMG